MTITPVSSSSALFRNGFSTFLSPSSIGKLWQDFLTQAELFSKSANSLIDRISFFNWRTLALFSTAVVIALLIENHYSAKRNQLHASTIRTLEAKLKVEKAKDYHQRCKQDLSVSNYLREHAIKELDKATQAHKQEINLIKRKAASTVQNMRQSMVEWCEAITKPFVNALDERLPDHYLRAVHTFRETISPYSSLKLDGDQITSSTEKSVEIIGNKQLVSKLSNIETNFNAVIVLAEDARTSTLKAVIQNAVLVKEKLIAKAQAKK